MSLGWHTLILILIVLCILDAILFFTGFYHRLGLCQRIFGGRWCRYHR